MALKLVHDAGSIPEHPHARPEKAEIIAFSRHPEISKHVCNYPLQASVRFVLDVLLAHAGHEGVVWHQPPELARLLPRSTVRKNYSLVQILKALRQLRALGLICWQVVPAFGRFPRRVGRGKASVIQAGKGKFTLHGGRVFHVHLDALAGQIDPEPPAARRDTKPCPCMQKIMRGNGWHEPCRVDPAGSGRVDPAGSGWVDPAGSTLGKSLLSPREELKKNPAPDPRERAPLASLPVSAAKKTEILDADLEAALDECNDPGGGDAPEPEHVASETPSATFAVRPARTVGRFAAESERQRREGEHGACRPERQDRRGALVPIDTLVAALAALGQDPAEARRRLEAERRDAMAPPRADRRRDRADPAGDDGDTS